jgi:hypothetical protein
MYGCTDVTRKERERSKVFLYLDLGVSLHAKPLGDGLVTLGGDSQLPLDDEGLVSGLQQCKGERSDERCMVMVTVVCGQMRVRGIRAGQESC